MEKKDTYLSDKVQQLKSSIVGPIQKRGIISKQQLYFQRVVMLDWSLGIIIILQLLLLHCYFQLNFAGNIYGPWFLRASCVTGVVVCAVLTLKYFAKNNYLLLIDANTQSPFDLIIGLLVSLIMPYPLLEQAQLKLEYPISAAGNNTLQNPYQYKLNYLLTILACFRISYFFTALLIKSKYMSPRSNRICRMYSAQPGLLFCLRSIFKDSPFSFITSIFVASVLLFSFMFRVAQCDIYQMSSSSTYSNMVWMTIITMTTVGYGDYTPKTEIGRILGAMCVSWGVLIVSVMVVVLTSAFSMNRNESQSLNILKKLQTNTELRQVAGEFIRESLWRIWKNYKFRLYRRQKMSQRKLMLKFRHFRRLRDMSMISESEIDFYNELVRQFQRAFINLQNLTSNNLMIINYLNEEYIFKEGLSSESEQLLGKN